MNETKFIFDLAARCGGKSEKRILRIWHAFAGLIPDKKQNDEWKKISDCSKMAQSLFENW